MIIINEQERLELINKLNKEYGIIDLDFRLIRFGEEKIRIFSGDINENILEKLDKRLRIESIGLYSFKYTEDKVRLTIDILPLLKDKITKNILELSQKDENSWLKGNELYIESDRAFKVLKSGPDLIGCGKSTGTKITNFVPKERRIK